MLDVKTVYHKQKSAPQIWMIISDLSPILWQFHLHTLIKWLDIHIKVTYSGVVMII